MVKLSRRHFPSDPGVSDRSLLEIALINRLFLDRFVSACVLCYNKYRAETLIGREFIQSLGSHSDLFPAPVCCIISATFSYRTAVPSRCFRRRFLPADSADINRAELSRPLVDKGKLLIS